MLETLIAAPATVCFELSLSVEAHLASAAGTNERVVAGRSSGTLQLGERVTWEARHLGRLRRLETEITVYERPHHFRDEQVRGPFRRFVHDHRFETTDNGTRMSDVLEFAAYPVVDRLLLLPYLRRFLVQRNETIRRLAEAPR
jgi:ligand-binding SRPBCC domain-containing protein